MEYWYACRETNIYKYVSQDADGTLHVTDYPEWSWYSSLTPVNAYGPGGSMAAFPRAFHGQDNMRIANFQASDLYIHKEWMGEATAKEVFVKIWRKIEGGEPEDFTEIIARDVRDNQNWQAYVEDESDVDTVRNCLILKGDGTHWTDTLKVDNVLVGSLAEEQYYTYYIQEIGYRDLEGRVHTNANAKYKPLYDYMDMVDEAWTGDPVGAGDYAENAISIGAKGENHLKVINRGTPSTSYRATKAFAGSQSASGTQSSVSGRYPTNGTSQVVLELQQRYRYEKTEGGVDSVSADGTTWLRADDAEAANTWLLRLRHGRGVHE